MVSRSVMRKSRFFGLAHYFFILILEVIMEEVAQNHLAEQTIGRLMRKHAVSCIIRFLLVLFTTL